MSRGGSWCPACRRKNDCDCEACHRQPQESPLHKVDYERDLLGCGHCGEWYHPDASLEVEREMRARTGQAT